MLFRSANLPHIDSLVLSPDLLTQALARLGTGTGAGVVKEEA